MDLGLEGRRALVTAASKGLGRACAEALVAEGAKVFIASRDAAASRRRQGDRGRRVAGGRHVASLAIRIACRCCRGEARRARHPGRQRRRAAAGHLSDHVRWRLGPRLSADPDERCPAGQRAACRPQAVGQGRIVFITSISVRQPIPNITLSNSLRAAVTGLAKTLSREVARDGITVNCLAPDAILTDRIRQIAGRGRRPRSG